MKRYTFELTITEGNHEFWEELLATNATGCDELTEQLTAALAEAFADEFDVKLVKYEDK
jgi:hypothetical protein